MPATFKTTTPSGLRAHFLGLRDSSNLVLGQLPTRARHIVQIGSVRVRPTLTSVLWLEGVREANAFDELGEGRDLFLFDVAAVLPLVSPEYNACTLRTRDVLATPL